VRVKLFSSKSIVVVCSLSMLAISCSRSITSRNVPFMPIIPSLPTQEWNISGSNEPLKILYLGCGHLVLQYKKECTLIDPFFSTQGIFKGKIHSDPEVLKKFNTLLKANQVDLSHTSSLWLAHTHYDHMMDIPLMLENKVLPEKVSFYGNEFGDDILANFIAEGQYHELKVSETYDPNKPKRVPSWINASSSVRVLPILSDHAPHFKAGPVRVHLMSGQLHKNYFKDHFKKATDTTKRNQWKEGCTYSFLVDFMNGEDIAFRLFIQTSASNYPLGQPPLEMLKQHPVDVALLCVASANFVKPYPVQILNDVKPKKVVFIHWEDFFSKPLDFDGARLVRATNFRKLNRRLVRNDLRPDKETYVMPRPGTMITIR
jgi:L-ascorbate metabolism protein UlaG (beta-lactamase superfamily)